MFFLERQGKRSNFLIILCGIEMPSYDILTLISQELHLTEQNLHSVFSPFLISDRDHIFTRQNSYCPLWNDISTSIRMLKSDISVVTQLSTLSLIIAPIHVTHINTLSILIHFLQSYFYALLIHTSQKAFWVNLNSFCTEPATKRCSVSCLQELDRSQSSFYLRISMPSSAVITNVDGLFLAFLHIEL